MPLELHELSEYLDQYLAVRDVSDWNNAVNGLQVDNSGSVTRFAVAVDACQATIDRAAHLGADLLIVHHGLFWGGLEPLTGRHGRRVRALIKADMALYSVHLPLDLHPEVGNNVVLAKMLGLEDIEQFGNLNGHAVGVLGRAGIALDVLIDRLSSRLCVTPHVIPAGPPTARRIGVVTGGGGSYLRQAADAGADTYVSGEGSHHTHFDAEEWGLNLIYAGHYATETVGVRALGQRVQDTFDLPWDFIDHPTGL
jgi:dinuclear metal center YbgI/SA1388 family protein